MSQQLNATAFPQFNLRDDEADAGEQYSNKEEEAGEAPFAYDPHCVGADAAAATRRRRKRQQRLMFKAIDDSNLGEVQPDEANIQQVLYILGRACFLSSASINRSPYEEAALNSGVCTLQPEQWKALFKTIKERINEMDPLEITRASQGLAYAKKAMDSASKSLNTQAAHTPEVPIHPNAWLSAQDECNAAFEEIQRHVATNVHLFKGDCLSRIFYASLKGGFKENAGFIEFACSEGTQLGCINT